MTVIEFYMQQQNTRNKLTMAQVQALAKFLKCHDKPKYINFVLDLHDTKFINIEEYNDLFVLEVE
jgi:hypothetical protein